VKYDKNSFLAGISVGRTLKGWAAGSEGFSGGTYGAAITQLSGYASTIKIEEFNYGNLLVGPTKLTGED
jgi:hypothetical protein